MIDELQRVRDHHRPQTGSARKCNVSWPECVDDRVFHRPHREWILEADQYGERGTACIFMMASTKDPAFAQGIPDGGGGICRCAESCNVGTPRRVQQRNRLVDGTDAGGGVKVSDPSDRIEREAVANADWVMASAPPVTHDVQPSADGAVPMCSARRQSPRTKTLTTSPPPRPLSATRGLCRARFVAKTRRRLVVADARRGPGARDLIPLTTVTFRPSRTGYDRTRM